MKLKYFIFILFLFMAKNAFPVEITTQRGFTVDLQDGQEYDSYKVLVFGKWRTPKLCFWDGTIKGINDVTFKNWSFVRKTPHTEVFQNCRNLTFIDCDLTNVEIPPDSTTIRCRTLHKRIYEQLGKKYMEIEGGDNKTRVYEIIDEIDEKNNPIRREEFINVKETVPDNKYNHNSDVLSRIGL